MTVGELKKYLNVIPDNTQLYVGYGDDVKPLKFLCEWRDGLMFHPNVYNENVEEYNLNTVLKLMNYESK